MSNRESSAAANIQQSKKHALLIGVNEYDFLGELSFAQRDAEEFSNTLLNECGFKSSEVQLMTCSSRGGLRAQSRYVEEMLSNLTKFDNLDLLVFGFWGHGFSSGNGGLYLCGYDAREDDLERSAVPLSLVKAKLAQVGAEDTLCILDCCQARTAGRGSSQVMERSAANEIKNLSRLVELETAAVDPRVARSIATLTSCKEGETAYEWQEREHGVFTAHLIDGMRNGLHRASELADYVSDKVPQTSTALFRQQQTPWYVSEGRGDVLLNRNSIDVAGAEALGERLEAVAENESDLILFSGEIREILFAHRRENPCRIAELVRKYNTAHPSKKIERDALLDRLKSAKSDGLLSGFHFNADVAFLSVELLSSKIDLNRSVKERIGRYAALKVYNGMTIGIDSGSTALAFAAEVVSMMESGALEDIHVVTNSLAITNTFVESLVKLEQGDKRDICEVTLIGGWCRPKSLATVPRSSEYLPTLISAGMLPENLDLAFVAANGFYKGQGFANSHEYEVPCKRYLSSAGRETIYLMESRKLNVEQRVLIENFRPGIELITEQPESLTAVGENIVSRINEDGGKVTFLDG